LPHKSTSSAHRGEAKIKCMKIKLGLILTVQAALVVMLAIAVRKKRFPLGVPGEWEWMRVPYLPTWLGLVLAGLSVVAYAGFAAVGLRSIAGRTSRKLETAWLTTLLVMAIGIQVMIPIGAPEGYDLAKWASVNYVAGSTGYFQIARKQAVRDPWRFLVKYPEWIRDQDSLHIGTHPPGLIVLQCVLLRTMEQNPALSDFLLDQMPSTVEMGFRAFAGYDPTPLTRAERAGLYATALLTLLACAGTVVPLYLLARATLPAPAAWAAAALWPLAPAANLFQPVADTAYPLLSTSALAMACWAARFQQVSYRASCTGMVLAAASGMVMAFGMAFTLAFLPIGLMVALVLGLNLALTWKVRAALIIATGVGFLSIFLLGWAITGADPVTIASWNLHHHARFYDEYPRTYRLWLVVNPIETAIAVGLPSVVWCALGLLAVRSVPLSVWSTLIVLVLVNLIGRNLGEVARLWILFMPLLLVAAGHGCTRLGAGPATLAGSIVLLGVQTLALQSMIQVVYPV
jgi:methylthioxylose transferase